MEKLSRKQKESHTRKRITNKSSRKQQSTPETAVFTDRIRNPDGWTRPNIERAAELGPNSLGGGSRKGKKKWFRVRKRRPPPGKSRITVRSTLTPKGERDLRNFKGRTESGEKTNPPSPQRAFGWHHYATPATHLSCSTIRPEKLTVLDEPVHLRGTDRRDYALIHDKLSWASGD